MFKYLKIKFYYVKFIRNCKNISTYSQSIRKNINAFYILIHFKKKKRYIFIAYKWKM